MHANPSATLAGPAPIPPEDAGQDRRLHQLTDRHAASEAASALEAASARAAGEAGLLARLLVSAHGVWGGGLEERGGLADDATTRARLREAAASPEFLRTLPAWIRELRGLASNRPDTGACTLATAFEVWLWTMTHFVEAPGERREWEPRVEDELADVLCPLLAGRSLALEIAADSAPAAPERLQLRTDLCHVHAAHASALAGASCAELVFGYRSHPQWDAGGCAACYGADELEELEGWMPGITSGARGASDVVEADGTHPAKAGPCARFDGVDTFLKLRTRLDGCLSGARLARDRAASALARTVVPSVAPAATREGRA